MAHAAGTSARTHRLIGLLAALLLAATTALAFGRVFLGATSSLQLVGAAVAAAGLAVVFERRSLLLSTVASAAGLVLAVSLIVYPGTTWYGLPTADTLRAALDAAAVIGEQARIQAAPAEPIGPLLLAAVVSLWAAVFSAHALAFRAGSPLLGLIPPVALVAFADTVLEEFVKPLYGVAFLAAALLVVFADGLARVQGWGPIWSSARRGVARSASRGARRLALTALGVAVLAPIFVPGFGSKALVDFGTPAADRVAIDPLVSVQNYLTQQSPVEVLRVTASEPAYIRLVALPDFDGVLWKPGSEEGAILGPGDPVPGALPDEPTDRMTIDVTADLAQRWLPTPYPMTSISVTGRTVRFVAATGTTFVDAPLDQGDTYVVAASLVQPTGDELRETTVSTPLENGRYLRLPENSEEIEQIRELARDWTEDVRTPFDKALAIQNRLQDPSEFTYTIDTPLRAGTRSILEFLQESRSGFCQQFSTAMAVMLRSIDIQSRVVVGFATGNLTRTTGQYSVMTDRAHAWVEVYFPGWGWMPFEPTPRRVNPTVVGYDPPADACPGPGCVDTGTETGGETASPTGPGGSQRERIEGDPRLGNAPLRPPTDLPAAAPVGNDPPIGARTALLIAAIVGAVILLVVPPARVLRRAMRRRGAAAEPRRLILVTYEQFTERAAGLGLGRSPGETLEEYRRKVRETGYLANGDLDRLTRLASAAAYSAHDPDGEQAREAGEAAETAIREIRRAVGPARWLVGLYRRP
ncbi:MAG: transglutaminase TgpA family protein [Actinomycetota bacterium]